MIAATYLHLLHLGIGTEANERRISPHMNLISPRSVVTLNIIRGEDRCIPVEIDSLWLSAAETPPGMYFLSEFGSVGAAADGYVW